MPMCPHFCRFLTSSIIRSTTQRESSLTTRDNSYYQKTIPIIFRVSKFYNSCFLGLISSVLPGKHARGIGSPHTYKGWIWHIALSMQALTSDSPQEILSLIHTCEVSRYLLYQLHVSTYSRFKTTDAGTGVMHESFDPNNPEKFTRPWFAWANSLFAELIREKLPLLIKANNT